MTDWRLEPTSEQHRTPPPPENGGKRPHCLVLFSLSYEVVGKGKYLIEIFRGRPARYQYGQRYILSYLGMQDLPKS